MEGQLQCTEGKVLAERSKVAAQANADSLRRADEVAFRPAIGSSSGGAWDTNAQGRERSILYIEQKHLGVPGESFRAQRRSDASNAAAQLQRRLSIGQEKAQPSDAVGASPEVVHLDTRMHSKEGLNSRNGTSSKAVLRVLEQCQQLEADIAARNWDRTDASNTHSQGGGEMAGLNAESPSQRGKGHENWGSGQELKMGARGGKGMGTYNGDTGGELGNAWYTSLRCFTVAWAQFKHVASTVAWLLAFGSASKTGKHTL
jgi:hypothetical protein